MKDEIREGGISVRYDIQGMKIQAQNLLIALFVCHTPISPRIKIIPGGSIEYHDLYVRCSLIIVLPTIRRYIESELSTATSY